MAFNNILCLLAIVSLQIKSVDSPKNPLFKISIDRKLSTDKCTQGYLAVNDSVIAYTLELPNKANKKYISSIPKGEYSAFIRTDGKKGWRLELLDVPNRDNVQIHLGNFLDDIDGCILLGTKVDLENCAVLNNFRREAIDKLQALLNKFTLDLILNNSNPKPIEITVEISGI